MPGNLIIEWGSNPTVWCVAALACWFIAAIIYVGKTKGE